MLLFLDVISPIPEIFVIEDNKVIFRRKILKNESDKLSDFIFETYVDMNDKLNLTKNLRKLALTIGPGSYTSLRVGAAFIAGLKLSKDLEFCPISIENIYKYKSFSNDPDSMIFYIMSSKDQKFICYINKQKKIKYVKLDENKHKLQNNIKKIFYNFNKYTYIDREITQEKFSFIDEVLENVDKLEFMKDIIINPIYISNNKILN
tara:strand:+ start:81 stop:695 length:615 start_codon:yes stop_codon:yes gene_type:complete